MNKSVFASRPFVFLTLLITLVALLAMQGAPLRASAPLQETMAATTDMAATADMAATEEPVVEPTAMPLSGDPVPVGIAVAQTSNVALLGQEEAIGAQLAEDFFNRRGGINGRPIKLVFQDTAGDEAGAINSFNTLINDAKVYGIVGPTLSQQAFAADPIADKAGVPVVAPSNTAKGIPQIGKYISRVSAPVAVVAPNAVKAALDLDPKIKTVAVFFAQNDAFSKSETGTFQDTVKSLGLTLLPVQTFQTTDTDFTNQATTALSGNPDLIIVSGLAADGGNLVKQLRDLGFKGLIIGGNGLNTANIFPVCKAQCDGVIIAQAYSYSNPSDINKSFRAAYKAKQQHEPPQFSAQTFTGVQVIVEALRKVDSATPLKDAKLEDARAALLKEIQSGTYDTPLGQISFTTVKDDKGNDFAGELVQKQYYVAQIKMSEDGSTGQFVFIR